MKDLRIESIDELGNLVFSALPVPQEIKIHDLMNLGELEPKLGQLPPDADLSDMFPKYFVGGMHFYLSDFEPEDTEMCLLFEYLGKVFYLHFLREKAAHQPIDSENFYCFEVFKTGDTINSRCAFIRTLHSLFISRILNLKLLSQIKTIDEVQPI